MNLDKNTLIILGIVGGAIVLITVVVIIIVVVVSNNSKKATTSTTPTTTTTVNTFDNINSNDIITLENQSPCSGNINLNNNGKLLTG